MGSPTVRAATARLAVIGAGRMGSAHLAALARSERCQAVAVVHEIDELRWLLGQEVDAVSAVRAGGDTPVDRLDPDGAAALAALSGGAAAVITLGRRFGPGDACWVEVFADEGYERAPFTWGAAGGAVFHRALAAQAGPSPTRSPAARGTARAGPTPRRPCRAPSASAPRWRRGRRPHERRRARRGHDRPGQARGRALPVPDPEPGAVVLKMTYSGICGTDKHTFRGETLQYAGTPHERRIEYPLICGHENVGTIAAIGGSAPVHDSEGAALRVAATASAPRGPRICSAAGPS